MSDQRLTLGRGLAHQIAELVRDARLLIGWSQRGLADRATTSQTSISRIERAMEPALDVLVLERVLGALGIRATLDLEVRHLEDRRPQRDAVHARLSGYLVRRLERAGWRTATEVPIGESAPRGWIDLLAFRDADRALLVEESKTEIHDVGGLQRSLAFYEREAWDAARRLGWRPARSAVTCVALDTSAVAQRIADNWDLVSRAFPSPVAPMREWIADPSRDSPRGWTLAVADPADRRAAWLRPTALGRRRQMPAYAHYAEAAARLRARG